MTPEEEVKEARTRAPAREDLRRLAGGTQNQGRGEAKARIGPGTGVPVHACRGCGESVVISHQGNAIDVVDGVPTRRHECGEIDAARWLR